MEVRSLRPGLWCWSAPHPDWTPAEGGPGGWSRDVWSLYCEAPDACGEASGTVNVPEGTRVEGVEVRIH